MNTIQHDPLRQVQGTGTDTIVNWEQNGQALKINWADSHSSIFHYMWLRDNCSTMRHSSGNRNAWAITIPDDIHPESVQIVQINEQKKLEIAWANDKHVSQFDPSWLRAHCYTDHKQHQRKQPKLWDATLNASLPKADYADISTNDEALRNWLTMFRDYGFAILSGIPVKSKMILEVAEIIGYAAPSIWKNITYHDVKVEVNPEFIGFTNLPLLAHIDDPYFDPVPPITMLHCLANEVEGGQSTLVDGFKVANTLRERDSNQFDLLSTLPVRHSFRNDEFEFWSEFPMISINVWGEVDQIRCANQHMKPFHLPVDVMDAYYDAYRTFSQMLISDEFQVSFKLKPGDLYMVNNHRVLHGRTGFSSGGARHMQHCYVSRDGILSRLAQLSRKKLIGG